MKNDKSKILILKSKEGTYFLSPEQFKTIRKMGGKYMFKEVDKLENIVFTSQEMNFCSYETELELLRYDNLVKTKNTVFSLNGKDIPKKRINEIITSLQTPLDLLEKEYKLEIKNNDQKIIEKLKAEKHFEMMAIDEEIYHAVCYIIYRQSFNESKNIFISLNELHSELGYKTKLTNEKKRYYKKILRKLGYLRININLEKVKYNKEYKKFYEEYDNIEGENLLYVDYFLKKRQKSNKTTILREGFITRKTQLMILHTEFTNRYYISPLECRTKIKHSNRLKHYIKKMYFIDRTNKRPFVIGLEKIFSYLKEFSLEDEYLKTDRKKLFLERQIFNLIDEMKEVKLIKFLKTEDKYKYKFEIIWDF